ncbi:MAG: inorganic phosphate transporter [Nitrospirae bacterium]|nr:inorganic phosphate transporter [Nitrospirota bacterium]MBI5696334.1 inorganic phosphate transporter [Nitrospirota bacterium]
MPDLQWTLVAVIILAIGFDFMNGFHDAANAIATSVSTRVLTPRQAIVMAAVLNLLGAFTGTAVAKTVGSGIVEPSAVTQYAIIAALLSAIIWDVLTWYLALPTSSSHALIASLMGAGVATAGGFDILKWGGVEKVLIGLIFSPLVGFVIGLAIMVGLMWYLRNTSPSVVTRRFKKWQILSAGFMAYSHGGNDAQKTMGIITMALVASGHLTSFNVPLWVILLCALTMAAGTAGGGWKIIKTLGMKLAHLKPVHGFAAETAAASVIEAASFMGLPLSTTHVISSTIMGVGASKRFSAVKWGVGGSIVMAWILTLPACFLMAWGFCKLIIWSM